MNVQIHWHYQYISSKVKNLPMDIPPWKVLNKFASEISKHIYNKIDMVFPIYQIMAGNVHKISFQKRWLNIFFTGCISDIIYYIFVKKSLQLFLLMIYVTFIFVSYTNDKS